MTSTAGPNAATAATAEHAPNRRDPSRHPYHQPPPPPPKKAKP
jgi:hypothetical protein